MNFDEWCGSRKYFKLYSKWQCRKAWNAAVRACIEIHDDLGDRMVYSDLEDLLVPEPEKYHEPDE